MELYERVCKKLITVRAEAHTAWLLCRGGASRLYRPFVSSLAAEHEKESRILRQERKREKE